MDDEGLEDDARQYAGFLTYANIHAVAARLRRALADRTYAMGTTNGPGAWRSAPSGGVSCKEVSVIESHDGWRISVYDDLGRWELFTDCVDQEEALEAPPQRRTFLIFTPDRNLIEIGYVASDGREAGRVILVRRPG
jgi:hypothetical protein